MCVCVIGCIFGKKFKTVYPSVKNYDAYLFSNNTEIKEAVKEAGWKYIFVDFPLSDDDAVSSFQSKYIKFLQFLKDEQYEFFKNYDKIIYSDHKLEITDNNVDYLLKKMKNSKILIIKHFQNRENIWIEAGEAMFQKRYQMFMIQTIDYIKNKINEGYSENCVIVLTGLIVYSHLKNETIEFADKVYGDLLKIGTSQCQIVWSLLSQKYMNIIRTIEWKELSIKPEEPKKKENQKLQDETDNTMLFLSNSVDYLKQEFINITSHIDLLMKNIRKIKGEIKDKTDHIEKQIEYERQLKKELQKVKIELRNKNSQIEQIKEEINNTINSRSWKISSGISAIGKRCFRKN